MRPLSDACCLGGSHRFYFFFVYFGVVINWIWFLVPIGMLVQTVREDFAGAAAHAKSS